MAATADIGKHQVASVYAKALIDAMEKKGATEQVVAELSSLVTDVLARFPQFQSVIDSPRLSPTEKDQLIERVFGSLASDDLKIFLKVLSDRGRLDCLREVSIEARRLLNELRNRTAVEVTTAKPLTDDERNSLVHELQLKLSCEIDLQQKVDEDILGGIVVRVGDKVIDGSVRNRLREMRSQAVRKVVEQIHDASQSGKFAS